MKKNLNSNAAANCCMRCCICYLKCFESFIRILNTNAYIMIGLTGEGFCKSAKHAFFLIARNAAQFSVTHGNTYIHTHAYIQTLIPIHKQFNFILIPSLILFVYLIRNWQDLCALRKAIHLRVLVSCWLLYDHWN